MVRHESSIWGVFSFYRVSSDYKIVKNEEYELASIDGKTNGLNIYREEDGRFNLNSGLHEDHTLDGDYSFLIPDYLLNQIYGVKTCDEIIETFGSNNFFNFGSGDISAAFNFHMPVVMKQKVAAPGYKKGDLILDSWVVVDFIYDNEEKVVEEVRITININQDWFIYEEPTVREIKSTDDLRMDYLTLYDYNHEACMYSNSGIIITDEICTTEEPIATGDYSYVPYYVAERGTVEFNIDNTINGVSKYNVSKGETLDYKVTVKNVGNAASSESVIKSYVSSTFNVKEDSISNNGVYNKDDHSITWNIDRVDIDETIELTFKITAFEEIEKEELVGYSTIECGLVAGVTKSNDTLVTMDNVVESQENPLTNSKVYLGNTNIGLPLSYLIVFLVVICFLAVVFVKRMKYLKK